MTSRLNPYIGFSDNARQAMEFYRDVFGGELALNTYGELGGAEAIASRGQVSEDDELLDRAAMEAGTD